MSAVRARRVLDVPCRVRLHRAGVARRGAEPHEQARRRCESACRWAEPDSVAQTAICNPGRARRYWTTSRASRESAEKTGMCASGRERGIAMLKAATDLRGTPRCAPRCGAAHLRSADSQHGNRRRLGLPRGPRRRLGRGDARRRRRVRRSDRRAGERVLPAAGFFEGPFTTGAAGRRGDDRDPRAGQRPAGRAGPTSSWSARSATSRASRPRCTSSSATTVASPQPASACARSVRTASRRPRPRRRSWARRRRTTVISEVARLAAEAAEPKADIRGSAEYKRDVVRVFVQRGLRTAVNRAQGATA